MRGIANAEIILQRLDGMRKELDPVFCTGCDKMAPGCWLNERSVHVENCMHAKLKAIVHKELKQLYGSIDCPKPGCLCCGGETGAAQQPALPVNKHMKTHREGLTQHLPQLCMICSQPNKDGQECRFQIGNGKLTVLCLDAEMTALYTHLEVEHGWAQMETAFCHDEEIFLVSIAAIKLHFADHVKKAIQHGFDKDHFCKICIVDDSLAPSH